MIPFMFEQNIYVNKIATDVVHWTSNNMIRSAIAPLASIDSIGNFDAFKEGVKRLKAEYLGPGKTFGSNRIASESLFYGHLRALVEYSGREYREEQRLLLPNIEHGIGWLQRVPSNVTQPYVHCAVSQGAYRSDSIRGARSWLPHYVVGPYIHYASSYYSDDRIAALKKRWGKTLLVFPAHTYELSEMSFGKERFVESVMSTYESDFDTILVSAYWHDADDVLFELFQQKGATIVSSGMREDDRFISRLKTLILLSDAVVGNAIGTHIGYCMCLGKPFAFIESDDAKINDIGNAFKTEEERELASIQRQFEESFSSLSDKENKKASQVELYEKYWGGDSAIKTPEEVSCILDISQEVLKRSHGFTRRFPEVIEEMAAAHVNDVAYGCLLSALGRG